MLERNWHGGRNFAGDDVRRQLWHAAVGGGASGTASLIQLECLQRCRTNRRNARGNHGWLARVRGTCPGCLADPGVGAESEVEPWRAQGQGAHRRRGPDTVEMLLPSWCKREELVRSASDVECVVQDQNLHRCASPDECSLEIAQAELVVVWQATSNQADSDVSDCAISASADHRQNRYDTLT